MKIKDKNGTVHSVQLTGVGGKKFSCPDGTHDKVAPLDIKLGRIKLTLQQLRVQEDKLDRQYPNHTAPHAVVVRYNALAHRDDLLVAAFNAQVDAHNAIIDRDCTQD